MPIPLTRRRFVAAAAGLGAAALGDGFLVEPTAVQVTRHDVPVPGLASALDGLRIACVADVHLHRGVPPSAHVTLERLAHEQYDVLVLIGDICNHREDLATLVSWTRDARGAAVGFATLGNWEHTAGIDRRSAERAYEQAGVELLYNSTGRVTRGGATLALVGIDDPVEGNPDLEAALAGTRAGEPSIWLIHGPGYVDGVPSNTSPRPAAVFAGHTHGGQIRLPFWTPYTPRGSGRFIAGWYRDTIAPLYVSRGVGTVFPTARLFCRPELPVFTLKRT